jgi:hypothetical protein
MDLISKSWSQISNKNQPLKKSKKFRGRKEAELKGTANETIFWFGEKISCCRDMYKHHR